MKKLVYVLIAVSLVLVLLPAAATTMFAGGEGCTPGYWKQLQHEGSWVNNWPTQTFSEVFKLDCTSVVCTGTLLQALQTGGGGENALARHAVAALLNASNPDVGYEYSVDKVIAIVQAAYTTGDYETVKNQLEEQNELDCPLGLAPTPTPGGGPG